MIFKYDPGTLRKDLKIKGYAHLKNVLSDEFFSYLKCFCAASMLESKNERKDFRIADKKRQFVFEFPREDDAREFRSGLARVTGMEEKKMMLSERHLKVYDGAASPFPPPHKDRAASQFSIGIPIHLPKGSTVCMFPNVGPGLNQKEHAVFLDEHGGSDPSEIYKRTDAVMLNEKVGDVIVFRGSYLFHERVHAAHTAVLYLKINDNGLDPLGENIFAETH